MMLNFAFKNIDSSEALQAYTTEKSEKLNKYFNGKVHMTWNFKVEHDDRVAHCHLVGNNMDYFGEAQSQDFHASVDLALDKIEKQLRKHKEIVKDHLHKHKG